MKRSLLFFIIISLLPVSLWSAENLEAGVKELSVELSSKLEGKAKIAVVPFSNLDGDVTSLGKFIAEELITALLISEQQNYEIIERRQLNRVLEEQDLSIGDILEPQAIQKIGKILGVDAIVTGSTADLGNNVRINCRVISVSTAKVYAACQTMILKVGIVEQLLTKISGARIESFDPNKKAGTEDVDLDEPEREYIDVQEADGVSYKLVEIVRKSSKITFKFIVKGLESGKKCRIIASGTHSRIVDPGRNEVFALSAKVGSSSGADAKRPMVQGIELNAEITFPDIDKKYNRIQLAEIRVTNSTLQYKNLRI